MAKRLLKVASIKIGDIAVDGGMGTVLAAIGTTYQGTCNVSKPEPNIQEEYCEESDDPEQIILSKNATTFQWGISDWEPATLVKVFGGTVDTTDADHPIWNEPSSVATIEQSLQITAQSGVIIKAPRVSISASVDDSIGKDKSTVITVKATVLKPTKANEAAMQVTY